MNPKDVFKFCPRCGGRLKPREESLRCISCGFDLYINPYPTNGAIIESGKKEILLVKRKIDPQKGLWDVPGGFIQPGESLDQSVKREVLEELNVAVKITGIVGFYQDVYLFQEILNHTFCVMVTANILNGELKASDDAEEYGYFPKEQILDIPIAFAGVRKGIEDYLKTQK